jgi:hypothetical protein
MFAGGFCAFLTCPKTTLSQERWKNMTATSDPTSQVK